MTRNTLCILLLAAAMSSSTGCIRRNLAPTFAKVYRNIMATQVESKASRPVAPVKGDEAKRVIRSYYGTLSPDGAGSTDSAASAVSQSAPGQNAPGQNSGNANPFNFKVR